MADEGVTGRRVGVRSAVGVRERLFQGTVIKGWSPAVAGRFSLASACMSLICCASAV